MDLSACVRLAMTMFDIYAVGERTLAPVKTKPVKKVSKVKKVVAKKAPTVRKPIRSVAASQIGFSVEAFEALLASRSFEPEWMRDRRRDAFHVLLDTPLPTRNDE